MRGTSPPGSITMASFVSAQARTVQLHSKGPAGNVSRSSTGAPYSGRQAQAPTRVWALAPDLRSDHPRKIALQVLDRQISTLDDLGFQVTDPRRANLTPRATGAD